MFKAHEHRARALEMLIISLRTPDQALRTRYEQLSALWVSVAERRERLDWGEAPGHPNLPHEVSESR